MKTLAMVLGLLFASTAQATLITSASDLALTGGVTETFAGAINAYPTGLSSSTFNIQNPSNNNRLQILDNSYTSYAGINNSSNFLYFDYNDRRFGSGATEFTPNPLKVVFNQATSAFGFNYAQNCSSFELAIFNILDELIESHFIAFNTNDLNAYAGASSSQNIAYFIIRETSEGGSGSFDEGYLDNLTTVTSVPLPGAVSLFIFGLGFWGFARHKFG